MTTTVRSRLPRLVPALASFAMLAGLAAPVAAEGVVNLYSSRHYDTDERLYADFTAATGIEVNRIEGKADELIARIEAEGANSPADILLTVDAGRIWRADEKGLLAPVDSEILSSRIPEYLSHPDGHWFAFSQRARIIFYDKDEVPNPPLTYADLASPAYEGLVCTRSGSNIYMLSLMAAMIEHIGEEEAEAWATGMWKNRARDPQGGDTDQLRAIISGECDIVVSNTYYFARAIAKDVDGVTEGMDQIGWVFPDQAGNGAHVNVSVGAVTANAPNRDNAIKFLEYLASESAQEYFSNGNNEYPAVPGVALAPPVAKLGLFRADDLPLSVLGENQTAAQALYDKIGYE